MWYSNIVTSLCLFFFREQNSVLKRQSSSMLRKLWFESPSVNQEINKLRECRREGRGCLCRKDEIQADVKLSLQILQKSARHNFLQLRFIWCWRHLQNYRHFFKQNLVWSSFYAVFFTRSNAINYWVARKITLKEEFSLSESFLNILAHLNKPRI